MNIVTALLILFTLNTESYPNDFFTANSAQLDAVCADATNWPVELEDMCNTFAEWSY